MRSGQPVPAGKQPAAAVIESIGLASSLEIAKVKVGCFHPLQMEKFGDRPVLYFLPPHYWDH